MTILSSTALCLCNHSHNHSYYTTQEGIQFKKSLYHFAQLSCSWMNPILCAGLLRLQYFTLCCETQEIINKTCQTIEHNDLSLIPLAGEALMFLLGKIDLLHTRATLTKTQWWEVKVNHIHTAQHRLFDHRITHCVTVCLCFYCSCALNSFRYYSEINCKKIFRENEKRILEEMHLTQIFVLRAK